MENAIADFGILSILPPLLAILLALISRHVILSLFSGIWLGATFIYGNNPITGFFHIIDRFIQPALADPDHAAVIIFSLLLGGMVGVISKNGGTFGIVKLITRFAHTPRSGQLSTWFLGLVIFFDDYANTLIVGHTMRPITDRLKTSREKLAFIVDSTAAPVAGLTISTWIGYELGLISDALKQTSYTGDAFSVFFLSIPYRFYAILAIFFVFWIAFTKRDFGPMLTAEKRARNTGQLVAVDAHPAEEQTDLGRVMPDKGVACRWYNGLIPIAVVMVVTLVGLYVTGMGSLISKEEHLTGFKQIMGSADPFQSLFWASLCGSVAAIFLSVVQKILSVTKAMEAWLAGVKSMILAMIILTLAWSIGAVTKEMHTAEYLTSLLKDSLNPAWLPTLTFLLAAATSFATGTSWGTMAILMPLVLPLAWTISISYGMPAPAAHEIFLATVSSVLAGSIFGDHCSPISDTTVMSSMASACDHIDHVRTQLPYAMLIGFVCVVACLIPSGFGVSPAISLVAGAALLMLITKLIGKRVNV